MAKQSALLWATVLSVLLFAGLQAVQVAAQANSTTYGTGNNTEVGRFIQTLNSSGYTRFASLLESSNTTATLAAQNSTLTVFAPTNEAFDPVLQANPNFTTDSATSNTLLHHFVRGYYNFSSLAYIVGSTQLTSLDSSNDTLVLNAINKFLYVNNATIVDVNVLHDGTFAVQGINFVLPPSGQTIGNLSLPILTPEENTTALAANATTLGLAEEQRAGIVLRNNSYNTFLNWTALTNFNATLQAQSSNQSITIFAPTDAAFANFEAANPGFSSNHSEIFDLLANHVAVGYYPQFLLATNASNNLTTLASGSLPVSVIDPDTYVGPARVVDPNLVADNQIAVHGVNNVIGLANVTLANTTIAAPPGVGQLGPQEVSRQHAAHTNAGIYSSILTLLSSTGLNDTLAAVANNASVTVFAPTDQAFSNAGLAPTASKQSLNTSVLTPILEYHVAMGYYPYAMLLNMSGSNLTTTEGANLTVNVDQNNIITINNASLVQPNLLADQYSAAHGINEVLLLPANSSAGAPPGSPPAASPSSAPAPAPSGASQRSIGYAVVSLVFAGLLSVVALA